MRYRTCRPKMPESETSKEGEIRDLQLEVVVLGFNAVEGSKIVNKYATYAYCNLLAIKRRKGGETFG